MCDLHYSNVKLLILDYKINEDIIALQKADIALQMALHKRK